MTDPVVNALGHTYERAAIEAWLAKHDTGPLSFSPLSLSFSLTHSLTQSLYISLSLCLTL